MADTFRALCAELLDWVERASDFHTHETHDMMRRARAALAQPAPEPVAPTDEEIDEFAVFWWGSDIDERTVTDVIECCSMTAYARAALARWGTPAIQPEPVSKRPPGPEDCDSEGRCWFWHPGHKEDDFSDGWILLDSKWAGSRRDSDDSLIYTYWLPHWALPDPANNAREEN